LSPSEKLQNYLNICHNLLMSTDKQTVRFNLRKQVLTSRDQLKKVDREVKSAEAQELIWNLPAFQQAANFFVYVNYRSELETLALIKKCIAKPGWIVTVPLTLPKEGLLAYEISDPEKELAPGYCSLPEPVAELTCKFDPAKIDVVILPGSVFDINGGRLGYGGGYYDKFLANCAPQALRIGLAYEMQVVDCVPLMDHDQHLDYLVTEKRVINCEKNSCF
jgi:5-formyltetrahydrofolate cyclo-ligase